TQYVYGTTLSDSGVASTLLKRAEVPPDPAAPGDRTTFKYNRQGEVTEVTDRNGTVRAFDYDGLGRQTQDRVTTLGAGVDGAVRHLQTAYEVLGMPSKLTSYDNATVGSGSIVNEVAFTYNDFGQVTKDAQSYSGGVLHDNT